MDICREEIEYRWLEAARSREQSLQSGVVPAEAAAESWQRIGFCYDLASRQAKDVEEFKNLRQTASEAYDKAAALFEEGKTLENRGRSAACLATAEYLRSWLNSSSEKVNNLDKCRAAAKKALQLLKKAGKELLFGQTSNLLSQCLFDRLYSTVIGSEAFELTQEAMDNSKEAITILSKLGSKDDLLFAFSLASILAWYVANTSEKEEERKNAASQSVGYAENAIALSKEVENPYSKAMSRWAAVFSSLYFTEDIQSSKQYAKEMMEQASIVKDNYLKGVACYLLAHTIDWEVPCEGNPDKRKEKYDEIIKYAEDGIRFLDIVLQDSLIADTYLFPAQTYSTIASDFAVNRSEKLIYSKRAIDIGRKGLEYAIRSCSRGAMLSTLHGLSKAYYYHSNLEPKTEDKPQLLRDSLSYRKEYIKIARETFPSNLWILGVGLVYSAQIETALVNTEKDDKSKITLLEEAIADMSDGVSNCRTWIVSRAVPSVVASVAGFEDTFGGILEQGYWLTSERENLAKANQVYSDAAEDFKKVDLPSRVAESYWKIAKNSDYLSDYDQGAKNFENAFAAYKAAAQRINQFSDFYLDYAYYMKAWSEIEAAKRAHDSEDYAVAMQHYEKTSQLLRESKSWMYLSLNFYAWSLLEQAEDLSRKENNEESIESFEKSIKFLIESKRILTIKLEGIDKTDERDLVKRLIEVSGTREEYSRGRIAIEQAKVFDKQGDHVGSSEKYDRAANIFQKMSLVSSEQAGIEAKSLIHLCRAWQRMAMAEARCSPIMYEEAAELFKLAKENTSKGSASLLALGHSSFCKALEAGTEFEITRTMAMYDETVRHMDAASDYYLKAGFETASKYAKATQRLFDAYVFMESAKRERDPAKQAKFYSMAEKVLQVAADYFVQAKYQDKNEQVQRLLRKVKDERQLALSLSEIFHAPTITSSTASFSTISPIEEEAVGLERFEHADIQAKLIQHVAEIKVGDSVNLEIQIVNVGKEPVSLTRIENLLPEGFQLVGKPDYCLFENMQLTMKGKRLDPLKTDEMKLALRSFKKGSVEIKPRIICVDSTGHQMSYSPEPAAFNVSGAVLPGRVPTGYADLDNLLFGGIPENYAIILASPSSDEREQLIKKFLETGAKKNQTTLYITMEAGDIAPLAEEFQSNFYVFVCNPRADAMIKSLPNVFKLKGVESLTDIEIALVKSCRTLDSAQSGPRRACITIISDVLLQHHAIITRKWLSGLLIDLRAKGFTTLAVINLQMHPQEEVQAILGLFEGEIRITEKETDSGLKKLLRIRKLYNQRYLENEIEVTRDKLES
jgi:KaiC/GvpD/RAD55 family RecA-like ATPase